MRSPGRWYSEWDVITPPISDPAVTWLFAAVGNGQPSAANQEGQAPQVVAGFSRPANRLLASCLTLGNDPAGLGVFLPETRKVDSQVPAAHGDRREAIPYWAVHRRRICRRS